jgi:hypothetical protein
MVTMPGTGNFNKFSGVESEAYADGIVLEISSSPEKINHIALVTNYPFIVSIIFDGHSLVVTVHPLHGRHLNRVPERRQRRRDL